MLLKYLFTTVAIDDHDAKILRFATTKHYQLVPTAHKNVGHIGYLPLPALQSFCGNLCGKGKEYASLLIHAKGVANANLSTLDTTPTDTAVSKKGKKGKNKNRSKNFEMSMFHALCGAVLAQKCLTEDMFRHSPKSLPKTRCTEIEWTQDVELFPSAVENGETLRVCEEATLHRICKVGAFNKEGSKQWKGLAFVPTDKWNTCCDFVLVLPTEDRKRAGRVVFAVQCKHWATDWAFKKGPHALAYFRYGRHCFEADKVFVQKNKEGAAKRYAHSWRLSVSRTTCIFYSVDNSFRDEFCKIVEQQNKDSDTRVVFVLATVNDIMKAGVEASALNEVNLPAKYKKTALQGDEGLMDLQHMCGWCPTVGYGALLAEKLQHLWCG